MTRKGSVTIIVIVILHSMIVECYIRLPMWQATRHPPNPRLPLPRQASLQVGKGGTGEGEMGVNGISECSQVIGPRGLINPKRRQRPHPRHNQHRHRIRHFDRTLVQSCRHQHRPPQYHNHQGPSTPPTDRNGKIVLGMKVKQGDGGESTTTCGKMCFGMTHCRLLDRSGTGICPEIRTIIWYNNWLIRGG